MTAITAMTNDRGLNPNAALKLFFQDPSWRLHAGIGSLMNAGALVFLASGKLAVTMLPIAFLIWAAAQGYILRVVRTQVKQPNTVLPGWGDWLELLISGLSWMAIVCGQIIVFISVFTVSLIIGGASGCLNALSPQFKIWAYATALALSLVFFVTTFFFPLLMANFAEHEKVTAAFSVNKALRRLANRPLDFILVWLLSLGIYTITAVIPLCTVIGTFFIPMTSFVASVVNAIMLGQVWSDAE